MVFFGDKWSIFGDWLGFINIYRSTHKVLQLLFSTFPLIMTFKFGSFLAFWGPMGVGSKVK